MRYGQFVMTKVHKLNITLSEADVRLLKKHAAAENMSLSDAVSDAVRLLRQRAARKRLFEAWGGDAAASEAEMEAIRKEWRG